LKQKHLLSKNEHEDLIYFDKIAKSIAVRENTDFSDQLEFDNKEAKYF